MNNECQCDSVRCEARRMVDNERYDRERAIDRLNERIDELKNEIRSLREEFGTYNP